MAKGISPEAFSAGTGVEAFTGTSNQETQVAWGCRHEYRLIFTSSHPSMLFCGWLYTYIYTIYIYVDILYIHSWHQTVQVSSGPSDMKYFFLLFKQCHLDGGQWGHLHCFPHLVDPKRGFGVTQQQICGLSDSSAEVWEIQREPREEKHNSAETWGTCHLPSGKLT